MATSYTSLLGLALPVTGELQGTWGDTVNNSITSLLDTAIAGTTTLSTDGDVTLSATTGASNQARQAILLCTGARTALRTITAPAQSKIYTVINATSGGFAVKLVGVGPTTGLTIPAGASAVVAWNGSDFIEIGSSTIGNLTVNGNLTVTGNTTLGDAVGDLVTVNGTATFTNANPVLSAGTANGVAYLNGSKVLTSGSALTFDGTSLAVGGVPTVQGELNVFKSGSAPTLYVQGDTSNNTTQGIIRIGGASARSASIQGYREASSNAQALRFYSYNSADQLNYEITSGGTSIWSVGGSEQMRLTSTGLGIGTSSPSEALTVARTNYAYVRTESTTNSVIGYYGVNGPLSSMYFGTTSNHPVLFVQNNAEQMRLTSTGLGVGTTSPTHKLQVNGAGRFGQMTTGPGLLDGSSDNFRVGLNQDNTNTSNTQVWSEYTTGASSASFAVRYRAANDTGTASTRMYLDAVTGNLGLGVTPSAAWSSACRVFQFGAFSALNENGGGYPEISFNSTQIGASSFWYRVSGNPATRFSQTNGAFQWFTAPSGTAGNAITFTQAMTLNASGNLGIGTTSPASRLHVAGTSRFVSGATSTAAVTITQGFINGDISSGNLTIGNFGDASSEMRVATRGFTTFYTGATDNATGTERMRLDSSGNLGLGTSSPSSFDGTTKFVVGTGSGNPVLTLYGGNATYSGLYFADGTTGNEKYRGFMEYDHATDLMRVGTAGGTKASLDSSGNLGIGVTPSARDLGRAIEVGVNGNSLWNVSSNNISVTLNANYNSGWKYARSDFASHYDQFNGQHRWWTAPSGTAGNAITFTQAMTLDASGNLGIGTTSPSTYGLLSAVGSTNGFQSVSFVNTSTGTSAVSRMQIGNDSSSGAGQLVVYGSQHSTLANIFDINNANNAALRFLTNNTERARIDSSGRLLVGTTSASGNGLVQVVQATTNSDTSVFRNSSASPYGIVVDFTGADPNNASNYAFGAYDSFASTWMYRIWSNGTVSARSDERFKKNIEPARGYLGDLNKIQIVKYNWYNSEEGAAKELGWLAQQVETVFPGMVQTDVAEDGTESKSVKLSVFTPMLIKAVQELTAKLDAAEARIAALEAPSNS